jgi:polar amino acid transport system substrate-binding protein
MQTIVDSENHHRRRVLIVCLMIACLAFAMLPLAPAMSASTTTSDRVKETNRLTLGYRTDAQPFSYRDTSGAPAGYSVTLCQRISDQMKVELGLPNLAVEWVPVTLADRFSAVVQGEIDLMCGADAVTLARRKEVAFSIPIFRSGIGAVLRADAPASLRDILADGEPPPHPVWRASPARTILEKKTFSAVAGTSGETWLAGRLRDFQVDIRLVPVESYEAGFQRLLDGGSDVFFGDRPILLVTAKRRPSAENLIVLDRLFTDEPLALVLARGDEDLRLLVDRTLSRLFRSKDFPDLYTKWFDKPDSDTICFFRSSSQPE